MLKLYTSEPVDGDGGAGARACSESGMCPLTVSREKQDRCHRFQTSLSHFPCRCCVRWATNEVESSPHTSYVSEIIRFFKAHLLNYQAGVAQLIRNAVDDAATFAYLSQNTLPAEWYAREYFGARSTLHADENLSGASENMSRDSFCESAAERMLSSFPTINPLCAAKILFEVPSLRELFAMPIENKIRVS